MSAKRRLILLASGMAVITPLALQASPAQSADNKRPSLVISNAPIPQELQSNLYTKPIRARDIQSTEVDGESYFQQVSTPVTQKVAELEGELQKVQSDASSLAAQLASLQRENKNKAADYYAAVATINTQLQNGTTPGNPRLLQRFAYAESSLENMSSTISYMNQMAVDLSRAAAEASFLLDSVRSAFTLSGAIEEDHIRLEKLEDNVNSTVVMIDRITQSLSNDISRATNYLSSERNNLRILSLAVTHGNLYGKSLSNRPFSKVKGFDANTSAQNFSKPRPLVKIRFDRSDVDFEQPVYAAMNEALQRYPNAQFDLVAIHPTEGNTASLAIESTRARRNAQRVMRTLMEMGMNMDQVELSYGQSPEARSSEVHIYIR